MEIAFIPSWLIKNITEKFTIQHELNILISNVFILLLFLIFKSNVVEFMNLIPHFCIFDILTGIECPVCGVTRAFCEISKGNYLNAYHLNQSSFFILTYFISQIVFRVITLNNNKLIKKVNNLSKIFGRFLIGMILINWVIKLLQ
jgi:hypothetical protein